MRCVAESTGRRPAVFVVSIGPRATLVCVVGGAEHRTGTLLPIRFDCLRLTQGRPTYDVAMYGWQIAQEGEVRDNHRTLIGARRQSE